MPVTSSVVSHKPPDPSKSSVTSSSSTHSQRRLYSADKGAWRRNWSLLRSAAWQRSCLRQDAVKGWGILRQNSTCRQVCGRPLILHCLKGLEDVSWVERIVVVADDPTKMADIVRRDGLSKVIVTGGTGSRHLSIRAGVEELSSDAPDVVVVQDGVRPLMPLEILTKVVKAAEEHGASGAVRSLVSTVVKPDEDGFLQESLVRSQFLNSEMPQAFRYSVLRQAYQRCTEYEMEHGTECLALALTHCGVKAKLIPGPPQLWKVTDEKDLAVARIVVPKYTRRIVVACQALSSSSPVQESKFRDSPKPEGPKIHSEECTFLPSGAIPSTEAEPSHTDAQTMSSVSKTGQNEYEIRSDQDKNSRNTAVKPFQTEDPCLCCDRECLRVYKTLQESLETNSQRVSVSDHLDTSWDAACSLIVISNLEILTSFKGYLKYLCQQLDKRLITVILILTLNDNIKDLTFMNISNMQHSIIEASNGITANVTLVLRKRRTGGLKRRLTEFQGEDQASTSKPHTTGMQSVVPSSSQVAMEERIPSGTCKSRAQAIQSPTGIHKHEVAAETKVPTGDYEEEEEEWRTPDPKLANMIKTILDEQTGCFNGQVMLLEEEKEHLE